MFFHCIHTIFDKVVIGKLSGGSVGQLGGVE